MSTIFLLIVYSNLFFHNNSTVSKIFIIYHILRINIIIHSGIGTSYLINIIVTIVSIKSVKIIYNDL